MKDINSMTYREMCDEYISHVKRAKVLFDKLKEIDSAIEFRSVPGGNYIVTLK